MPKSPNRPATYADLEALPDNVVGELIDGELFASPRPGPRHAQVIGVLNALLWTHLQSASADRPSTWRFLIEPELHFGPNAVVPDVAGWRASRMPTLPETAFIELAPDWICEVASPSTAKLDRKKKLPLYAKAGVNHVWLVDPAIRTLDALQRDGKRWLLLGTWSDDDRAAIEPFSELELDLSALWAEVIPSVHDG
ncbi:MAG: Uma2 family endonuclease [Myxococcaceae bacterium]